MPEFLGKLPLKRVGVLIDGKPFCTLDDLIVSYNIFFTIPTLFAWSFFFQEKEKKYKYEHQKEIEKLSKELSQIVNSFTLEPKDKVPKIFDIINECSFLSIKGIKNKEEFIEKLMNWFKNLLVFFD